MAEPISFSTVFLTGLVTRTAEMLLEASARLVKRRFEKKEQRQTLETALAEGLEAALKTLRVTDKAERDHYQFLFEKFLTRENTVVELTQLIDPRPNVELNLETLTNEFIAAGFDPQALPDFSFEEFLRRFVGAFYDSAARQAAFQGAIEIGLLRGMAERLGAIAKANERTANATERIADAAQEHSELLTRIVEGQLQGNELNAAIGNWFKNALKADLPGREFGAPVNNVDALATRFAGMGQYKELFTLVAGSNAWAEARYHKEQSYVGYLNDLKLAWRWAESTEWNLGRQIRCALIESSLHSRNARFSPDLLEQLVQVKQVNPAEALSIIALIPHESQRVQALAKINRFLNDDLHEQAMEVALKIEAPGQQAEALSQLAPWLSNARKHILLKATEKLPDGPRAEVLRSLARDLPGETYQAAKTIQRGDARFLALAAISPNVPETTLSKVQRIEALQEAARDAVHEITTDLLRTLIENAPYALSRRLEKLSKWTITQVMRLVKEQATKLIPSLGALLLRSDSLDDYEKPAQQELMSACLSVLGSDSLPEDIRADFSLLAVLVLPEAIIAGGPESQTTPVFQQALQAAQQLKFADDRERDEVFSRLAVRLPNSLIEQALQLAAAIADDRDRAWTLSQLLPRLQQSIQKERALEVFEIACALPQRYEASRIVILSAIIDFLPDDRKEQAQQAALQAMRLLELYHESEPTYNPRGFERYEPPPSSPQQDEKALPEALQRLIAPLPDDEKEKVVQIINTLKQPEVRSMAWNALLPILPERLRNQAPALEPDSTEAQEVDDPEVTLQHASEERWVPKRIEVLTSLAPRLHGPYKTQALQEALRNTKIPDDPDAQYIALTTLAKHLPEEKRVEVLREALHPALEIARQIEDYDQFREAVKAVAPDLPDELPDQFLKGGFRLPDHDDILMWASALKSFAPDLPDISKDEARHVANAGAGSKQDNKEARVKLLSPPVRAEVEEMLANYRSSSDSFSLKNEWDLLLKNLLVHAPYPPGRHALRMVSTINNDDARGRALCLLVPHLPPNLQSEALQMACKIEKATVRVRALCDLAQRLLDELKALAGEYAWQAVKAIEVEADRAQAFWWLRPILPKSRVEEALSIALALHESAPRALAVAGLAPCLPEHLIQTAWDAIRLLARDDARALALTTLAPRLPKEDGPDACKVIRAMKDRDAQALALCAWAAHWPDQETYEFESIVHSIISSHGQTYSLQSRWESDPSNEADPTIRAWFAAQTISNPEWRLLGLTTLAPHLPDAFIPYAWRREVPWSPVLESLAPRLPESMKSWAWRECLNHWVFTGYNGSNWLSAHAPEDVQRNIRQRAKTLKYKSDQAVVLSALAAHCQEPLRTEIAREALQACFATDYWPSRAKALRWLAPHLPKDLMPEALRVAQSIQMKDDHDKDAQVRAFSALVPYLSGDLRVVAWQGAWQSALELSSYPLYDEDEKDLIFELLAPCYPDRAEDDVVGWIQGLSNHYRQASTLSALAPYLQVSNRDKALQLARSIADDGYRTWALTGLVPHLADEQKAQVLQELKDWILTADDSDRHSRAHRLANLVPDLAEPFQNVLLQIAKQLGERWGDDLFEALALHGSPDIRLEVETIAQSFSRAEKQVEVFGTLASGESDSALSKRAWGKTIGALRRISNTDDFLKSVIRLAPQLPDDNDNLPALMIEALTRVSEEEVYPDPSYGLRLMYTHRANNIETVVNAWKQFDFAGLGDGREAWSRILRVLARRSRGEFLLDLAALMPLIERLGGAATLRETFLAIGDVTKWWP